MKISIGIEDNKTLIETSFFIYDRVGSVAILKIFNYPLYARVGSVIGLFDEKIVFDCRGRQ